MPNNEIFAIYKLGGYDPENSGVEGENNYVDRDNTFIQNTGYICGGFDMPSLRHFGAMWVGGPLTKIQEISLLSFLHYGHKVTLFVYDINLQVPEGVIKRDAREILDENKIFLVDNSYAAFSDLFRYHMIQKTGLTWTDVDNICLSSDWYFKDEIVAGYEYNNEKKQIVGGILRLNKNSEILKYLISEADDFDKSNIFWSEIGPSLVDRAFHLFGYKDYVQDVDVFYPISYMDWGLLWNPQKTEIVLDLTKNSKCISIYHQMVKRSGLDRNVLPKGSAMEYFYNKFVIQKEKDIYG